MILQSKDSDASEIVAEVVGVDEEDLPAFRAASSSLMAAPIWVPPTRQRRRPTPTQAPTRSFGSGTLALKTDDFKPIAPDGVVKFFGRVNPGGGTDPEYGPFGDIGANISLDEDVISGEPNEPPVMTLNISVPDADNAAVQLQVIYYETSGIEFILGGETCVDDPHISAPNLVKNANSRRRPARAMKLRPMKLRIKLTMLSSSTPNPTRTRPKTRSNWRSSRPVGSLESSKVACG